MKTASKTQVVKDILSNIEKHFGKSFESLKKEVKENAEKGGYGCSDHFDSKNGYSIFYTTNTNFMQGVNNGGGKGFFARLRGVGMCKDIKLSC